MRTHILRVDADKPDPEAIRLAAGLIKNGELVAFPTETVYGLGADGLNGEAVKGIFTAKGRPADNPLILHVASREQARELILDLSGDAGELAGAFWPGPLTLVAAARAGIPDEVRAGRATVGVRMPDHPVALALIEKAGVPLAAPSANRSGKPSPTSADHVRADLNGRIAAILDAGCCRGGIESTVLDVTARPFRVLRPGAVAVEEMLAAIPGLAIEYGTAVEEAAHYQPRAAVVPFAPGKWTEPAKIAGRAGLVTMDSRLNPPGIAWRVVVGGVDEYGRRLYQLLREADDRAINTLFMEMPGGGGRAGAVRDRIRQAARKPVAGTASEGGGGD